MGDLLLEKLTNQIISCYYDVYNTLGYGFLEKVYENAMLIKFDEAGLIAQNQVPIKVYFHDKCVGSYCSDIIVDNKVILELKAEEKLNDRSEYQLVNYLKATDIEVGLVLNFGKKPEIRRKIFTNDRKR
jgi:GxxExxY protein